MTATVRWLALTVAVAVGLEVGLARADSLQSAVCVLRSASALGQTTGGGKRPLTRAEVDKLLADARRAITAGNLDRAEALIVQAEESKVRYTLFHRESPKRVRRNLEKARAKAKSPALPSTRSAPQATAVTPGSPPGRPLPARQSEPGLANATEPALTRLPVSDRPGDAAALTGSLPRGRPLPEWPFGSGAISTPADAARQDKPQAAVSGRARKAAPDGRSAEAATAVGSNTQAQGDVQTRKTQALALTQQAREALAQGDIPRADRLAQQAIALAVPDSMFAQREDRPWLVALKVHNARRQQTGVVTADGSKLAADADRVRRSLYESPVPVQDANRANILLAGNDQPAGKPAELPAAKLPAEPPAKLPATPIDRLPAPTEPPAAAGDKSAPSLLDQTAQQQQLLVRKLSADVVSRLAEARSLLPRDPKRTLKLLDQTRALVAGSGVEADARSQLLRRVERSMREAEKYIQDNRAQIELDERNRDVLDEIDRRRLLKVEVGQKLADFVEQFNQLRDEQRFEEMEVVAKRARELAPEEPIVQQLWREARFIRRIMNNRELADRKEQGVFQSLFEVEQSAVPPEDGAPYKHPDVTIWEQLSKSRARARSDGGPQRSERERRIEQKLQTPVMLKFTNTPLAEVVGHLVRLTAVNIHLDDRGLAEEGVTTNEPVTINLSGDISLKSALNLILEPLHLTYVIKDEVLKITSEHLRDGDVYPRTYDVADLVIPIPNFVPGSHFGLQGAISDAHSALGYGSRAGGLAPPMAFTASGDGTGGSAMINPQLLAQMPGGMSGGAAATSAPFAAGPGGLGGGVQADFDSLIELITTTIEPESWEDIGGPGSIAPFETNLSLVVSQTQDIHEQIVDLLEQLRRLQDLQVTIEVRFITLSENFFERIGVDFDFNIVKNVTTDINNRPVTPSATVGINGTDPPIFTADLDIPFTQGSFGATQPQFGQFDQQSAANFGFAILSDIEAFFLIQAAQGDSRSNILNAPKVTLFNGQQAFVTDSTQRPFVISVIPVVGDFAAAQEPVIVVLSEGTSLSVQAVVSPDRRYVRLTVVPFFSQIGDVEEFTFEGTSTSTNRSSSAVDEDDDTVVSESKDNAEIRQGTTVQQPTFRVITVTTTVSVPDGGTVLLGGIKRLAEGRSEVGVPLLSKIPYVDRLFRNVSIGRETESLMMMVTPRIIIQEEEEERLLGSSE